ncbi:MAG: hypothetical protein WCL71_03555 [Deltaproteobacteria bacterium]
MAENTDPQKFQAGDLVIGNPDPSVAAYAQSGAKIDPNAAYIHGDPDKVAKRQEAITRSGLAMGGKVLRAANQAPTPKKGKKRATASSYPQESVLPTAPYREEPYVPPVQLKTVQFENSFGRMKAKVEDFAESDLAYMLVFSDEDALVFEPNVGETLTLHTPDRERVSVYYPGVTFSSLNPPKRYMILFKSVEEE